MTYHAQRTHDVVQRLADAREAYPGDRASEFQVIEDALTQAHAAGRRAGLEKLEGQIDQLGDSYFHLGNTQARLAIEAVEKLIAKAKEGA